MSVEEHIKRYAVDNGASAVGIASVEDIEKYAPKGHRPSDLLSDAKSVIVVGGPPITAGAWRSPNLRVMAINRAFPTMRATLTMKISSLIEREYGHYAIYYDAGDVAGLSPFLSLKLCAEMAGLGTRALAGGVILNRDHGLLSFACTITSMPLRVDGPLTEPVCPDEVCVRLWDEKEYTPCLEACPKCLSGELIDGKIRWMEYRRHLCVPQANWISAFQHNLNRILKEKHVERRRQMIYGSLFGVVVKNLIFAREIVGRCYECLRLCPVCVRTRILRPKTGE